MAIDSCWQFDPQILQTAHLSKVNVCIMCHFVGWYWCIYSLTTERKHGLFVLSAIQIIHENKNWNTARLPVILHYTCLWWLYSAMKWIILSQHFDHFQSCTLLNSIDFLYRWKLRMNLFRIVIVNLSNCCQETTFWCVPYQPMY